MLSNNYLVRFILFIAVTIIGSNCISQEICDNGLDDDGDGLIDLNDSIECYCTGIDTIFLSSLIPNPSFEDMNCCPSGNSQMNCAQDWIQASAATSDYLNTCGFLGGAMIAAGLDNMPDGNGCVAAAMLTNSVGNLYLEYVAACLLSPMLAGQSYTLTFYIASTPLENTWTYECDGGMISYGPIDMTLYGNPNCSSIPWSGTNCPSAAQGWQVLGSVNYTPVNQWNQVEITFTPTTNITTVALGAPCNIPASYTYSSGQGCMPYFYYDDLQLQTTVPASEVNINYSQSNCNYGQLNATVDTVGGNWQWYLNGIAINGATNSTLNVDSLGLMDGEYTAVYSLGVNCAENSYTIPNITTYDTTINMVTCDSIYWSPLSTTLYQTGLYTATFQTEYGCDSTINLDLTINPSFYDTLHVTVCDNYTWNSNGTTYFNSGFYMVSASTINGCDSTHYLDLTVFNQFIDTTTIQACDDYTWGVNGNTYTMSGFYTESYTTSAGCDSTLNLDLTIGSNYLDTTIVTACDNYLWSVNGFNYNTSGIYSETYTNISGCDSTLYLDLTILNGYSDTLFVTNCDQYLWSENGVNYNSSGTYTESYTNAAGCDSLIVLDLIINNSYTDTITVNSCGDYIWPANGNTYSASGLYTELMQTGSGCDSLITINLSVQPEYSITNTEMACDSFYWNINGVTYFQSGVYQNVIQTTAGCDSILILDLTILSNSSDTLNINSCNQYFWSENGVTYYTSGTFIETYTSSLGCDSLKVLVLSIDNSFADTTTVNSCGDYLWTANGSTYSTSGNYTELLQTINGCDSSVTIELTINPEFSITNSEIACDSFIWIENGNTYYQSGSYQTILQSSNGCDSVLNLDLIVYNGFQSTEDTTACGSYTWDQNGTTYYNSGLYSESYLSSSGCDSIFYLNLNISQNSESLVDTVICENDLIQIFDETFNSGGTFVVQGTSEYGCDSTIILNIYIYDPNDSLFSGPPPDCPQASSVEDTLIFFIPNAFTPDGGQFNEVFYPVFTDGFDPADFGMFIYNRWGELIWESHDVNMGWDGTYIGLPAQDDTYTWKVEFKSMYTDDREIYMGHVNLLR